MLIKPPSLLQSLRHWGCIGLLLLLAACGGSNPSESAPTVNETVLAVNATAFNTLSTFEITGNNLRSTLVGASQFCSDDFRVLGQNRSSIVVQCKALGTSFSFSVLTNTGQLVKRVTATVARPSGTYDITAVTPPKPVNNIPAAQLGAESIFDVTGSSLYAGIVDIKASGCGNLTVIPELTAPYLIKQIRCTPTQANPSFQVVTRDDGTVLSSFTADFSALPKVPLTISSVQPSAVGTKNTYTVKGYFSGASDVSISASNCNNIADKLFTPATATLTFSCTPASLVNVSFNLTDQNSVVLDSLVLPLSQITAITPDASSSTTAQLGALSEFNITGNNLFTDTVAITSDGCADLLVQASETEPRQIIKVKCLPRVVSPTFNVVAKSGGAVFSSFVAFFGNLPKAPLTVLSNVPSVVGTNNSYRVSGYFSEASAVNVAANNCSNITETTSPLTAGVLIFSCTPTNLDVTFTITNQSNTVLASLPMPIQVRIEMTVEDGAATPTKKNLLVNLDIQRAPVSVRNFLAYVDAGYYKANSNGEGTLIHRVEKDAKFALIQGGAFTSKASINTTAKPGALSPIALESTKQTGLSNIAGTLAMARTALPDSAGSQFYFNISDNAASLDYKSDTSPGYAVFGKVADNASLTELESFKSIALDAGTTIPTNNIRIVDISRVQ